MPTWIDRDEALVRIRAEGGGFSCLMCALRDGRFGPLFLLHQDERALVLLPRYVRRWGHVLVLLREHLTRLTHRSARVIEGTLAPRRCYLASTGSSGGELTQSSEHMHLHIIPILDPDDRPAAVFSWSDGIFVGSDDELTALRDRYAGAWNDG
jgi:diadenosine tetraphosphate (Ap4A) HIT family hydrolase